MGMPLSELQTWCAMWKVITPLIQEAPAKPSGALSGTGCISPYSCPQVLRYGEQGQDTHSRFGGEHPLLLFHTASKR